MENNNQSYKLRTSKDKEETSNTYIKVIKF